MPISLSQDQKSSIHHKMAYLEQGSTAGQLPWSVIKTATYSAPHRNILKESFREFRGVLFIVKWFGYRGVLRNSNLTLASRMTLLKS